MKHMLTAALVLAATQVNAQQWGVSAEMGVTLARLIPTGISSPQQGTLRYGFSGPGTYIAPEVQIKLSEHAEAVAAYQYSGFRVGTSHRLPGTRESNYDMMNMHGFALGVRMHHIVADNKLDLGAFAKAGFAYTSINGMGGSSGGGSMDPYITGPLTSSMSRNDQFDIVQGKWIPTTTIGFSMGPVNKGWAADRLTFTWSATVGWQNIYDKPASYDYAIQSGNQAESGTVRYEGMPFVMQMGVRFRMFDFGGKG